MKNDFGFLLRPDITFLNFGSFGACPQIIFDTYQQWQRKLEEEPVQHIAFRGPKLLSEARAALGDFIGADAEDVVFTHNPTHALNIVIKNLDFLPGDEILTTDLEYGAMDRTWDYYSQQRGWKYCRQHIPLPIQDAERFERAFWAGLTPKTRAIFLSHITSSTALILPVEKICARAKELGLLTIIDGAHAPAHVALNLRELDPDFYAGACHKWMMAPKGSSFLYAKRALQPKLDPLIVSWGYQSAQPSGSTFIDYHEFIGTDDFSAYLTVPTAIEFMKQHDWLNVCQQCRSLTRKAIEPFSELLETSPLAPVGETFFGQMCSLPICTDKPIELKRLLYDEFRIEIPVMVHEGQTYIRFSMQVFNTWDDIEILLDAMNVLRDRGYWSPAPNTSDKRSPGFR